MTAADRNRAIVTEAYTAFFAADFDGFFRDFVEEPVIIEAESLPYGGEYRGVARAKEALAAIQGAWDDLTFEMEELLASDTMVAAVGRMRGRAKSTGKPIDFTMVELWRFRDGRVVSVEPVYGDTHQAVAALSGA